MRTIHQLIAAYYAGETITQRDEDRVLRYLRLVVADEKGRERGSVIPDTIGIVTAFRTLRARTFRRIPKFSTAGEYRREFRNLFRLWNFQIVMMAVEAGQGRRTAQDKGRASGVSRRRAATKKYAEFDKAKILKRLRDEPAPAEAAAAKILSERDPAWDSRTDPQLSTPSIVRAPMRPHDTVSSPISS